MFGYAGAQQKEGDSLKVNLTKQSINRVNVVTESFSTSCLCVDDCVFSVQNERNALPKKQMICCSASSTQ